MEKTSNYQKHTSNNPVQKFLINNFFSKLILIIKEIDCHAASNAARNDKGAIESVLDVGCGEGFTLEKLRQEKIGKVLEGIEFSKEAISIGKKLHPNLELKQGDIYELPYKDNSFDLVISTEVLEHLEDPKKALKEIVRVSKKYILLSVPNEPWFRIQRLLRGKNIFQLGDHTEHIQHWSSRSFGEFVFSENIQLLSKKTPFPWTMILIKKS